MELKDENGERPIRSRDGFLDALKEVHLEKKEFLILQEREGTFIQTAKVEGNLYYSEYWKTGVKYVSTSNQTQNQVSESFISFYDYPSRVPHGFQILQPEQIDALPKHLIFMERLSWFFCVLAIIVLVDKKYWLFDVNFFFLESTEAMFLFFGLFSWLRTPFEIISIKNSRKILAKSKAKNFRFKADIFREIMLSISAITLGIISFIYCISIVSQR